jgi:hypothetical protein
MGVMAMNARLLAGDRLLLRTAFLFSGLGGVLAAFGMLCSFLPPTISQNHDQTFTLGFALYGAAALVSFAGIYLVLVLVIAPYRERAPRGLYAPRWLRDLAAREGGFSGLIMTRGGEEG